MVCANSGMEKSLRKCTEMTYSYVFLKFFGTVKMDWPFDRLPDATRSLRIELNAEGGGGGGTKEKLHKHIESSAENL